MLGDTKRVLRARQALFEDPLLAAYNLGVQLRDDVAILSGTLPDQALAVRAEEHVRCLGLFKDVRNELSIDPTCYESNQLPPNAPPKPHKDPRAAPMDVPIPALKSPLPESSSSDQPATSLIDAVTLLPPRPIPDAKKPPTEAVAVILPPRRIPAKDPSDSVEQLRRSEARFWPLQATVRDGVVTIRSNARGEEMYAFAQAVRLLPGVVRVVLDPAP